MSFLAPNWLYLLLLVPLLVTTAIILRLKSQKNIQKFITSDHYQKQLIHTKRKSHYWISISLFFTGLTLLIIATARPYKGKTKTLEKIHSRNILLAIDTSLSMLCEDILPNRLKAAHGLAQTIVNNFPNDRIAVMPFAGQPKILTPLSIDHESVKLVIKNLDVRAAPLRGSDLTLAIEEGIESLRQSGEQANTLIILTDGAESDLPIKKLAQQAKKAQVQIITIGIGTPAGGYIPFNGKNHKDITGRPVITKLEIDSLKQLSNTTNNLYLDIQLGEKNIIQAIKESIQSSETENRESLVVNELYQWFIAPAILLMLTATSMRRGAIL